MDDDPFGTSVWNTPSSPSTSKALLTLTGTIPKPPFLQDEFSVAEFDDFDDLSEPHGFGATSVMADGEDDFGDFGEAEDMNNGGLEFDTQEGFRIPQERPLKGWRPMDLDPLPSLVELKDQVAEFFQPIWESLDLNLEGAMTDEPIREAGGINRVLVTPESRNLYNILLHSSPPTVRTPNWIRSRIRRQHLITLGIPVNLDEVMPHVNGKALPVLEITTRPASAPPGPRPSPRGVVDKVVNNTSSRVPSRAGTPQVGTPVSRFASPVSFALPPKPGLDQTKVDAILKLDPDSLSLLPLVSLEAHLENLRSVTEETSSLLTYLLQMRDILQQDSETYNGLIAELVGEAQKIKVGSKGRPTASKRGSGVV